MRIISFAWTTPALVTGNKTVTRREWNDRYGESFRAGEMIAAYDRNPRFRGRHVATIRLTEKPLRTTLIPREDWEREGFAYLESINAKVNGRTPRELWEDWLSDPLGLARSFWVVRFELVSVEPIPDEQRLQGVLL